MKPKFRMLFRAIRMSGSGMGNLEDSCCLEELILEELEEFGGWQKIWRDFC